MRPSLIALLVLLSGTLPAQDLRVRRWTTLKPEGEGGRVAWSKSTNVILYHRGSDGYYEVRRMNPAALPPRGRPRGLVPQG